MEKTKRKKLEAAGFRIGDAGDFLELSEDERGLVGLRIAASRAIRRLREGQQLTQQQLASRIHSSQSRVAKMESGTADVSLDLLFRGLFALGGTLDDLQSASRSGAARRRAKKSMIHSTTLPV